MLQALLNTLFGCSHRTTTFPLTVQRKPGAYTRRPTDVVFLWCGAEFGVRLANGADSEGR